MRVRDIGGTAVLLRVPTIANCDGNGVGVGDGGGWARVSLRYKIRTA